MISQNNHSNKLIYPCVLLQLPRYISIKQALLSLRRDDFEVRVMKLRHEGYWVRFPCNPINFNTILQEKLKGAQSSEPVKPWVPSTWFL